MNRMKKKELIQRNITYKKLKIKKKKKKKRKEKENVVDSCGVKGSNHI